MSTLYGALVVGLRSGPDACSTVEARTIEGARRIVLLAAVEGDLATPALESVKEALARVPQASESAAMMLISAAPPPPYASGVAVVLLEGTQAVAAWSGTARCYLERGGKLEVIAPGRYELAEGEAIVAASSAGLTTGRAFLEAEISAQADDAFHHGGLDAALTKALSSVSTHLAVSAARAS